MLHKFGTTMLHKLVLSTRQTSCDLGINMMPTMGDMKMRRRHEVENPYNLAVCQGTELRNTQQHQTCAIT
jgi:hypothetical protein